MALDFVGTLVPPKGYDTILVMSDRLTNYFKFEPTHSTATPDEIADLVYRDLKPWPLAVQIGGTRNDKLFTSKFWKKLHKRIWVDLMMSTSFHPETDGSSERSNRTMIEAFHHYINLRQSDWSDHLNHVESAMNNSVNATMGKTPQSWSMELPFDFSSLPMILPSESLMYQLYQIIFSISKTVLPSLEIVTSKPK
jgi:hypothetical protein